MKKLTDIPKKNIFEVPTGYFDRLPMQIQARVDKGSSAHGQPEWNLAFRYALALVIVGLALAYFLVPKSRRETEDLLATVSSEHLIAYLHDTDISEFELLEIADFDNADADSLNSKVQSQLPLGVPAQSELKSEVENEL